jgi:hypothetical protein
LFKLFYNKKFNDVLREKRENIAALNALQFTQNKALDEQISLQQLLNTRERERGGLATTADLSGLREVGGGKSPLEQLDALAGEFTKVNEKALDLKGTIDNGINAGIDQFFNALANNQDPFKALTQSVKRLAVELAAAILKTFILQQLAKSAGVPGADRLIPALGGDLSGGGVNTLNVRTLRLLG